MISSKRKCTKVHRESNPGTDGQKNHWLMRSEKRGRNQVTEWGESSSTSGRWRGNDSSWKSPENMGLGSKNVDEGRGKISQDNRAEQSPVIVTQVLFEGQVFIDDLLQGNHY